MTPAPRGRQALPLVPAPTLNWWLGEGSLTPMLLSLESPAGLDRAVSVGRGLQDQPLLCCLDRRRGVAPDLAADWAASLSPAERQRLAALRLAADRERFLLGRGLLRALLGRWLNRAAAAVAIELGQHGKPHCLGGPQFNLSHSGDLILLAVHPTWPVGVDVEQHRPGLDWPPIARRMFGDAEVEALMQGSPAEQAQAFLQGWCLLEAGLKASGLGFAGHGAPGAAMPPPKPPLRRWSVVLPPGYGGALALLGPGAVAGSAAGAGTASGRFPRRG